MEDVRMAYATSLAAAKENPTSMIQMYEAGVGELFVLFLWAYVVAGLLSGEAGAAVKSLLPEYANGDLAVVCSWSDEALKKGKEQVYDVVLCDKSGPLHTNYSLMEELIACRKAIAKVVFGTPNEMEEKSLAEEQGNGTGDIRDLCSKGEMEMDGEEEEKCKGDLALFNVECHWDLGLGWVCLSGFTRQQLDFSEGLYEKINHWQM
ncbi:hypothetical protein J5N97_010054 [Dioscorea zingiberensis]|uniref:SRP54-type proteins GTP-binding domain-containing protein n=1 Tax=Dioscorea zingiberensis TaxID=325984 RepID=A0A9D5HM76_9LILI|nr:hypothetical protein J5N97_010054 [Dioscorea zingiberensis]